MGCDRRRHAHPRVRPDGQVPPRQGRQGRDVLAPWPAQGRARGQVLARPRGHAHGRAARHGREDGARLHRRRGRLDRRRHGRRRGPPPREHALLQGGDQERRRLRREARGPLRPLRQRRVRHGPPRARLRGGVTKYLSPSVSGYLLAKELEYLAGAVDEPVRPLAAIVGGSKVSSKITVLESLIKKCDKVIVGGGMTFTFLKALGKAVGTSLVEDDFIDTAKKAMALAEEKGCELIFPNEILVADAFDAAANTQVVSADAIPDGWMGLDNGPAATSLIQEKLADCKTVIWNGPMGVFEMDVFAKGTFAICDTLAELTEKGAITIIGGGDSVAAVEKAGLADKMSHISTGGGASLELLEGKVLPGVAALQEA